MFLRVTDKKVIGQNLKIVVIQIGPQRRYIFLCEIFIYLPNFGTVAVMVFDSQVAYTVMEHNEE